MPSRVAGRLLTSPLAFLTAGLIDVSAFWFLWARAAIRRARTARQARD